MFKWRSPVEINSHVWKSAFWREHTGNRLNWRQAPIARVLCVLCLLLLKLTAWIENAARAAPSGVCLRPHHLRVGREADQRILRCNRRTYRGSPIHAWLRWLSAPMAPQIPGAPPPPRTSTPVGGTVHQSAGSGYIRPTSPQGTSTGTGMRSFGPLLPADFVQNPNFLDTRTVAGVSLPRWVRRTDWTTKKQIDQCPTHVIPLHSVLYQGWNSYWIRHIAEGKPTFFAGFRSMAETVFCHALFSKLREESIELDELGMMISGGRAHQGSPITNDVKLQASQGIGRKSC